jgi:3-oxoacyl-[acyl-carrier protein] reductase
MNWTLEGRSAVCLAASQGLGFGIAQEMAAAGAHTLIVSRDPKHVEHAVQSIADRLREEGPYRGVSQWHTPEGMAADLLNDGSAREIMDTAGKLFGGIDILVNNIGGPPTGQFAKLTTEQWSEAFQRLHLTVIRQVHAALPWLRKSDAPRVLTVTSVSARQPISGLTLSNTFRPGLVGLAKTLAQEWGPEGILVNNLAPGMFQTDRVGEVEEAQAEARGVDRSVIHEERVREIPLRRFGSAEELGRVAVFLASPANTYVTGQTILVDGGLYRGL